MFENPVVNLSAVGNTYVKIARVLSELIFRFFFFFE
jgi:hypothetical protein